MVIKVVMMVCIFESEMKILLNLFENYIEIKIKRWKWKKKKWVKGEFSRRKTLARWYLERFPSQKWSVRLHFMLSRYQISKNPNCVRHNFWESWRSAVQGISAISAISVCENRTWCLIVTFSSVSSAIYNEVYTRAVSTFDVRQKGVQFYCFMAFSACKRGHLKLLEQFWWQQWWSMIGGKVVLIEDADYHNVSFDQFINVITSRFYMTAQNHFHFPYGCSKSLWLACSKSLSCIMLIKTTFTFSDSCLKSLSPFKMAAQNHFHFLRWLLKTAGRENWVRLTNLLKGSQLPGGPKTW